MAREVEELAERFREFREPSIDETKSPSSDAFASLATETA